MTPSAIPRGLLLLFLITGLLAACTSGDDSADDGFIERDTPQGSILPPAGTDEGAPQEPEVEENDDDGRLVIQSVANQLSTMLPDGTEEVVLTDDPTMINLQPSWAPDGSRVAWVSIDRTSGQASIAADRFDRSDFRAVDVDTAPFYLYWDPSASRIAHLSPVVGGIDLGMAELLLEEGPTTRRVDRGEPYWMSWNPGGEELLVHASGFRLDRIDLGSATVIIDEFPADFGAPSWLPDGSILFAGQYEGEQVLMTTGKSGEGIRPLAQYEGQLRFSVSNEGNRIAMQAFPGLEGTDAGDVVTASFDDPALEASLLGALQGAQLAQDPTPEPTPTTEFDSSIDSVDRLEPGIPYVIGTFGGDAYAISDLSAIAMFPSPNGQYTAWIEESETVPGAYNWIIDTPRSYLTLPAILPSTEVMQNYLPFFDQYSQSHDFWSPSSNLFVYAGRLAGSDEPDGIYVANVETGQTTRIADGVFAAFTRTPTASGAASAL